MVGLQVVPNPDVTHWQAPKGPEREPQMPNRGSGGAGAHSNVAGLQNCVQHSAWERQFFSKSRHLRASIDPARSPVKARVPPTKPLRTRRRDAPDASVRAMLSKR